MNLPTWYTEKVRPTPDHEELRVSTSELFFDLVFVFTITQLSQVLLHDYQSGALRVLLMFGVIWWMYSGYVWLTNAVPPVRPMRLILLLLAMAGWLIVALSIPGAFDGDGHWFAVGMLVVVLVHGAMYLQSTDRFLPIFAANLVAVAFIGVAAPIDGDWKYLPWALAVAVMWLCPLFTGQEGFPLHAGHITERHGLLVIILLGESIVAIGAGVGARDLSASIVIAGTLGLLLAGCLWWSYFHFDARRAEHALRAVTDQARRTRLILVGFFYFHVPLLLGVVAIAAALHHGVGHLDDPLTDGAELALGGGVALFLLGSVAFVRTLGLRPARMRMAAAVLALATVPLGRVAAVLELVALVLLMVALVVGEEMSAGRLARPRALDRLAFTRR